MSTKALDALQGLLCFCALAFLPLSACKRPAPEAASPPKAASVPPAPEVPPPPPPVPLPNAERAALSGLIAFVSERGGSPRVFLIAPDGTGERQLSPKDQPGFPAAASPDGTSLAVVAVEDLGSEDQHFEQLWLYPLGSGKPTKLGPRSRRARNPTWARDSSWLVFESGEHSFADLYRIRKNGKGLKRLTSNPEGNFEPSLSADSAWVAFGSSRDGNAEIYRMRADGTGEERVTESALDDWAPEWSPAGAQLAFLSARDEQDRIFLVEPPGPARRLRPGVKGRAPRPGEREPLERDLAWSPDGKKLAFTAREAGEKTRIWVTDVEAGTHVALTDGTQQDEMPAWSPDGRYLVFVSERTGDAELFVMRADGSGVTQLTRAKGPDWLPTWIAARAAPRAVK